MTATDGLLAAYLVAVAVVVPGPLGKAGWTRHTPRLAIGLWAGLVLTELVGTVFVGCRLAKPLLDAEASRTYGLHVLWSSVRGVLPPFWCAVGLLLVIGVSVRVAAVLLPDLLRARRRGRRCVEALDLVGRPIRPSSPRVLAVDHPRPCAYCLAARRGRIVLTTAALRILPEAELAAVLEHERAHLRGRHHLLTLCMASLGRAFPWIPLFATAGPAVARLVEMAADDAAARHGDPLVVARGLARLAAAPVGRDALNASGADVAERINRLADTCRARPSRSVAVGLGWCGATVVIPVLGLTSMLPFLC